MLVHGHEAKLNVSLTVRKLTIKRDAKIEQDNIDYKFWYVPSMVACLANKNKEGM